MKRWDVVVALGHRKALGAKRPRAAVFFNGRPVAEFTGSGDKMLAVVTDEAGHDVRSVEALPALYSGLPIGDYRAYLDLPGAPRALAVVLPATDTEGMVRVGYARVQLRRQRARG